MFFFGGGWVICIIGGAPDKRISKGSSLFLLYIFFLVFIGILVETPDKRISEVYFDVLVFCIYCFFLFGVFIGIRGGTPDKSIPEGLFFQVFILIGIIGETPDKHIYEGLFFKYIWGFSRHYRGGPNSHNF